MRNTIFILAIIFYSYVVSCESPPFDSLRIEGTTDKKYEKVSLFKSVGFETPIKTEDVRRGQYSIDIDIPADMLKKERYYLSGMRFWTDTNDNGIWDDDDLYSQCQFIIWHPGTNKVYFKGYKGFKTRIRSHLFRYNYE